MDLYTVRFLHVCKIGDAEYVKRVLFCGEGDEEDIANAMTAARDALANLRSQNYSLVGHTPPILRFQYTWRRSRPLDGVLYWDPKLETEAAILEDSHVVSVPQSVCATGLWSIEQAVYALFPEGNPFADTWSCYIFDLWLAHREPGDYFMPARSGDMRVRLSISPSSPEAAR